MRTLWQVTHHPSIWLKLDDRAGIKKNVVLSLVIKPNFVQPGRQRASSRVQRLEKENLIAGASWVSLASYILSGTTLFLIAFLSGTPGLVIARPWKYRRHVHMPSPSWASSQARLYPKGAPINKIALLRPPQPSL